MIRGKISLKARGLVQESNNAVQVGGIRRLTRKILIGTFIFESIGAVILSIRFSSEFGPVKGIYYGIFHSISAFCNAGFDLMGCHEEFSSMTAYSGDITVNAVLMILSVIGGIGFIVWNDISENGLKFKKYSLHTKIVLMMTILLIVIPSLLYFIFEYNNVMKDLSAGNKIMTSLFSSVMTRTAGFNIMDINSYSNASKMLTLILMFTGAAPGSTSGGIKVTTLCVLVVLVWSKVTGKNKISIFKRRFSENNIKDACAVVMLNLFLTISASMILLCVTDFGLWEILFEVVAALGSAGMTTGITAMLGTSGMIVIMILMFCGRVGSLSFALSFLSSRNEPPVYYPEEEISIG